jgi:hypothetical protein
VLPDLLFMFVDFKHNCFRYITGYFNASCEFQFVVPELEEFCQIGNFEGFNHCVGTLLFKEIPQCLRRKGGILHPNLGRCSRCQVTSDFDEWLQGVLLF